MISLHKLRKKTDQIDHKIIQLIHQRQLLAPKFARLKQQHNLPLHQPKREQVLLKKYHRQAQKLNLDKKILEQIFRLLIKSSLQAQQKLSFIKNKL
ncbi:chorismate mutase [Candidatus Woesearchaeota archaeon]|nr:chorismate mutase [Candidatus Woesearchaeota archaeon]